MFVAAGLGIWALTGEDDGPETAPGGDSGAASEPGDADSESDPSVEKQPGEDGVTGAQARAAEVREVERAVRRYVAAVDERNGVILCGLVDGVADLDLPVRRSSCAESVSESIGYRDPRDFPVFESATVAAAPEVELDGVDARATVTVVTEFADREEPSVEDDVIYLERRGGAWVVAKPSSTLYRAIGTPDVPPGVLQPPG